MWNTGKKKAQIVQLVNDELSQANILMALNPNKIISGLAKYQDNPTIHS